MQIAIVLYPGVTALDAVGPYEVLRFLPDCEVRFVSNLAGPVITDSGVLILGATHSFEETPRPDIVLVPGSEAETGTAMRDPQLRAWLQAVHQSTRWTTSVCSGALILAAAGLLDGLPATTHWIAQSTLGRLGAEPCPEQRIVASGKIMTAAGVSAGIDLALLLTQEICGEERAAAVQLMIEYDPQPPSNSGHPLKATAQVFDAARAEMQQRAGHKRQYVAPGRRDWEAVLAYVRSTMGKLPPRP